MLESFMEKGQLSRKLAVILHADVVDSTALVRRDETLAHQRIQQAFQHFSGIIKNHNGVAREIRGDALVADTSYKWRTIETVQETPILKSEVVTPVNGTNPPLISFTFLLPEGWPRA